MTKIIDYKPFHKFVFRSPTLPFSTKGHDIIHSPLFLEAIFLASPDLFEAINKVEGHDFQRLENKVGLSVLKYLLRMRFRSTPFGLFAGCGTGKIGKVSAIDLADLSHAKSFTRLDMDYLCAITDFLNNDVELKDALLYFPNDSIYELSNGARYVEYKFVNGKRKHFISEFEVNEYIELILQKAEKGLSLQALTSIVFDETEDFTSSEKRDFVCSLIENQVLISELQPTVTGKELLGKIIGIVENRLPQHYILSRIKDVENSLIEIDRLAIGRPSGLYVDAMKIVDDLGVKYNPKFLFQSDLLLSTTQSTVSEDLINSVADGLQILTRMSTMIHQPALTTFIEKFAKRYESREVPLVELLDPEIGIGFSNSNAVTTDLNELIEDVHIRRAGQPNYDVNLSLVDRVLLEKYYKCINENHPEIMLDLDDFRELPDSHDKLPLTIAVMLEVLNVETNLIHIKSAGGPSGTNLLGRFGHLSNEINQFLLEIAEIEQKTIGDDAILAEIVHLPEARIGNILFRPMLRGYEIPYLANASVGISGIIRLEDIMVSVINGNYIKLRSKKLNKEILPRLASAHNYTYNSLPIYSFLCMLQSQQTLSYFSFNWGSYLSSREFLPRVKHKNVIISPAKWNIGGERLKSLPTPKDADYYEKFLTIKNELNLPACAYLVRADNKLLIDFSDELSVKLLLSEIKERSFTLEEFLFPTEKNLVTRHGEQYVNELIMCFHRLPE
jgi:hypothetical protein